MAQTGRFVGWDDKNPRIGYVEWTGVRQRYCDGISYRWIVNGVVIELSPIHVTYRGEVNNPKKEPTKWIVPFEIPEWFHHNASYRVRVSYACNALQKVFPLVVDLPDIPFKMPDDKTGTLTEDGLDVLGVRTVNREMGFVILGQLYFGCS